MGPRLDKPNAKRLLLALGGALLLAFAAAPVRADFDPDAYPPYETCALCHGLFGVSRMAKFPHLGGQDPDYLEAQIRAFRKGAWHNDGGQMASIATELAPEDIAVVVDWFKSQEPPAPVETGDPAPGRAAYGAAGCGNCHDNADAQEGVPHLTSQHAGYLLKQMKDFRDGARGPGPMGVVHASMMPTEDDALEAISIYLAGKPRP